MSDQFKPPKEGGDSMKPISFNDEMVRAILDGRKTMTRRPVKDKHYPSEPFLDGIQWYFHIPRDNAQSPYAKCPYGHIGDLLAVDDDTGITIRITGVRVERLQDISEADARAEGCPPSHEPLNQVLRALGYKDYSRSWLAQLWGSIYGGGDFAWERNPWVWVLSFEVVK